jgi:DNA-binding LacI/PurR family transcriptional regulator
VRPIVYDSKGISFSDGLAIGRKLFSKVRRPTAIQCITDDMAAGLIASAHERRLLLPEALSISGFDNFGLATRLYPALSTATLPLMSMAVAATRQVSAAARALCLVEIGGPSRIRNFDQRIKSCCGRNRSWFFVLFSY